MPLNIITNADSIIINKLDVLNKSIITFQNKSYLISFLPLLAAIITGGIVLLAQYLERISKRKEALKFELANINTLIEMNLILIRSQIKDLAITKNYREFYGVLLQNQRNLIIQGYNEIREAKISEANDVKIKDAENHLNILFENEKHYFNNQNDMTKKLIDIELNLDKSFAEYYSNITKFKLLSKTDFNISTLENILKHINFFDNADEIDIKNVEFVNRIFSENKIKLLNIYFKKIEGLETINKQINETYKGLIFK